MLRYYLCVYLLAALGFSPVPGLSGVAVSKGSSLVAAHKALGLSAFSSHSLWARGLALSSCGV